MNWHLLRDHILLFIFQVGFIPGETSSRPTGVTCGRSNYEKNAYRCNISVVAWLYEKHRLLGAYCGTFCFRDLFQKGTMQMTDSMESHLWQPSLHRTVTVS